MCFIYEGEGEGAGVTMMWCKPSNFFEKFFFEKFLNYKNILKF